MVDEKKTATKKTATKKAAEPKKAVVKATPPAPKVAQPIVPVVEENVTLEPTPDSRVTCRRRG